MFNVRYSENRKKCCKIGLLFFFFICTLPSGFAQFYNGSQLSFGKNRVQFQHFNWTYYRNPLYDVYFYPTSKELAQYTYLKIPQIIAEVENRFNFTSYKKLQFIVYNTQNDFRESNFAFDDDEFYNQGGITNIYGTKVYLYFNGNHNDYDKMIKGGIANIYAHLLIEGQSMASNISSDYLIDVPSWFYSGLASYMADEWNSDIDAYVKNGILSENFKNIDDLSAVDATYAGHSFWKFILDRYGSSILSSVLYNTRSTRSIEKAFAYSTGVGYRDLLTDWFMYYYVIYKKDIKRDKPEDDGFLKRPNKLRDYSEITLAPDGERFAYVTNEAGQIKIWLQDQSGKKPKVIFKRYQKTEDNPDFSFPILRWHPTEDILGFTLEEKGRCYFYPYTIENKKLEKKMLVDVEKVTAWNYARDGKTMAFSGTKFGQSDIFIYNFRSRSYQNITNDFYDDYAPQFMNHGKDIIFSSNRPVDSLSPNDMFYNSQNQKKYDLFLYHYEKKDPQLLRVTFTPDANEYKVQVVDQNTILFLNDENGISNRYIAHFDSAVTKIDTAIHYAYFAKSSPLTNNAYSIFDYSYNADTKTIAEIILRKGVKRIYMNSLDDFTPKDSVKPSFLKNIQLTKQAKQDSIFAAKSSDSIQYRPKTTKRGFRQLHRSDEGIQNPIAVDGNQEGNGIETPTPFTSGFEFSYLTPRNYMVQYNINKLITQADYGFLNTSYQQFAGGTSPIYLNSGINALFMVGINDLFEDFRITGGFRASFDLSGTEFMLSYENLSKRIDHQIVAYRQGLKDMIDNYVYKQHSTSFFYIMKLPFNKFNSLRFSYSLRYDDYIITALDDISLQAENQQKVWGTVKIEYNFDSSKELETNLWRGSKCKLFAEYNQLVSKENDNLLVLGFDFRKSVKLFRNMTWTSRVAASTNLGVSRLVYYMGGVDNWINAKFDSDIWVDQSKNYQFQTLATNMRGFSQNIRNGTSFFLFSTELRIPFVHLVMGRRVSSSFLNSMQGVIFTDIGTAWTGTTPYSEENCLYTRYVTSGNITAMIKRQVDPFVIGFGGGLRCSLLGYFFRFDYAWGAENFKIKDKKGMFLFSIGTDF